MDVERIYFLIRKYINHSLSKKEAEDLNLWLETNKENKEIFANIIKLCVKDEQVRFIKKHNENAWHTILRKARNRRLYKRLRIYGAAAMLILIICFSIRFLYNEPNIESRNIAENYRNAIIAPMASLHVPNSENLELGGKNIITYRGIVVKNDLIIFPSETTVTMADKVLMQNQCDTLKIPRGGEYTALLSDGTKVRMNSDSYIYFPELFASTREVHLVGEAYFEVTHDEARPFVVNTNNAKITVLGTKFNVSAYPNEPVSVTVEEGRVSVYANASEHVLSADMQYDASQAQIMNVNAKIVTSWTKGVMEFESLPMETLVARLSRWYDVDICLDPDDREIKNMRFTGVIFRDKPLSFSIDIIKRVSDVCFERKGNVIVVSRNK